MDALVKKETVSKEVYYIAKSLISLARKDEQQNLLEELEDTRFSIRDEPRGQMSGDLVSTVGSLIALATLVFQIVSSRSQTKIDLKKLNTLQDIKSSLADSRDDNDSGQIIELLHIKLEDAGNMNELTKSILNKLKTLM